MKRSKFITAFWLCFVFCACLIGCGEVTDFSKKEKELFNSSFGFVIPFVKNKSYEVSEHHGYDYDLEAYEDGLSFIATGLSEEECEDYRALMNGDENFSYEYKNYGYYYYIRDEYFVKLGYFPEEVDYTLEVYVFSYRFIGGGDGNEDGGNGDGGNGGNEDGGTDDGVTQTTGIVYERLGNEYEIVGFLGDEDGVVEIPDTYNGLPVCHIRGNAFYGKADIVEVIIGKNVQSIEGNAFMFCSNLEKITLGEKVEVIDMQAFLGCVKLKEITIPQSVVFIGSGAFRDCMGLKSVTLLAPDGWCTSDDVFNIPFPVEDMSDDEKVAEYFTDTYVRVGWLKER